MKLCPGHLSLTTLVANNKLFTPYQSYNRMAVPRPYRTAHSARINITVSTYKTINTRLKQVHYIFRNRKHLETTVTTDVARAERPLQHPPALTNTRSLCCVPHASVHQLQSLPPVPTTRCFPTQYLIPPYKIILMETIGSDASVQNSLPNSLYANSPLHNWSIHIKFPQRPQNL